MGKKLIGYEDRDGNFWKFNEGDDTFTFKGTTVGAGELYAVYGPLKFVRG